jgi:hypothetical protein
MLKITKEIRDPSKASSRNRRNDRHSPGYMAAYMRKWRALRRAKQTETTGSIPVVDA